MLKSRKGKYRSKRRWGWVWQEITLFSYEIDQFDKKLSKKIKSRKRKIKWSIDPGEDEV